MPVNPDGIQIVGQVLPADFADHLRAMRESGDPRLSATLWLARQWGWGLTALGDALGVTREAIRQRIDVRPFDQYPTEELPAIPPPPRRLNPVPAPPKPRLRVNEELGAELRAMHEIARTVTGGTPVDSDKRRVSEHLSAQLAALVDQGVSIYHLAEVLGVTHLAVRARLARHGYRASVPSMADHGYRNVQVPQLLRGRRSPRDECKRGHSLVGENLGESKGQRYCRTCKREAMRDRYWRLKAASSSFPGSVPAVGRCGTG